jgi:hypothetical protein
MNLKCWFELDFGFVSKFNKLLIFIKIRQLIIANYRKQWGDKMCFLSLTSKVSRFSIAEKKMLYCYSNQIQTRVYNCLQQRLLKMLVTNPDSGYFGHQRWRKECSAHLVIKLFFLFVFQHNSVMNFQLSKKNIPFFCAFSAHPCVKSINFKPNILPENSKRSGLCPGFVFVLLLFPNFNMATAVAYPKN